MFEEIRYLLHAGPFAPFTIRVADGREYHVPTSDHVSVSPMGVGVIVWDDGGHAVILPMSQISGLSMHVKN